MANTHGFFSQASTETRYGAFQRVSDWERPVMRMPLTSNGGLRGPEPCVAWGQRRRGKDAVTSSLEHRHLM